MGYIDPNLFGILSQVGLGILLVVGVAVTFFRSFFRRLFGLSRKRRTNQEMMENSKENEQPIRE